VGRDRGSGGAAGVAAGSPLRRTDMGWGDKLRDGGGGGGRGSGTCDSGLTGHYLPGKLLASPSSSDHYYYRPHLYAFTPSSPLPHTRAPHYPLATFGAGVLFPGVAHTPVTPAFPSLPLTPLPPCQHCHHARPPPPSPAFCHAYLSPPPPTRLPRPPPYYHSYHVDRPTQACLEAWHVLAWRRRAAP